MRYRVNIVFIKNYLRNNKQHAMGHWHVPLQY